ncbi:MAG: threonine synthase [Clostridia bacterium]|nr:threonine synthase [Clostridia bacterium]
MYYQSTRDKGVKISSAEAIKRGISEDGGLFVPESVPNVTLEEIKSLSEMKYTDRAYTILSKFLTDYTSEEIKDCCTKAYSPAKFGSDDTAPVKKLSDTMHILELWHGPTCAFKDMALQILPHLLTKAVKKTGENNEIVILVATSGDTGKAALEGFKDVDGTRIQVYYPETGVSEIQKLQMITQEGNNVSVIAVKGNFDDAQTGVKKIFTDNEYKAELAQKGYSLSSANSINWGRLVPQIVYYFSAYADMVKNAEISAGDEINICVPTGNFGNILAAYYAKIMGLPVKKLICASNKNSVLTDFITTGTYDKSRDFYTTISPSMDIIISSNLERLLFIMSGCDDELISQYMKSLSENGVYTVSEDILAKIKSDFAAGCCDDEMTKATIKEIKDKYNYTADTHTAVAIKVYMDYVKATSDTTKTVIASTANPYKFNKSVLEAVAQVPDNADEFELLDILSKVSGLEIPDSLGGLKTKEIRFNTTCDKSMMKDEVSKFLA